MSIIAGLYAFNKEAGIDHRVFTALKNGFSTRPTDTIDLFEVPGFSLLKIDLNVFGAKGYFQEDFGCCAIAGEPYLEVPGQASQNRESDCRELFSRLSSSKPDVLECCNGSFSLCHFDQKKHTLILATDKVGVRPLYYYQDDVYLIFSSSIKILNTIDRIPKTKNIIAFIQGHALGIPLGSLTPYKAVNLLKDGQYLSCTNQGAELNAYHEWDKIPQTSSMSQKEIYTVFKKALVCRCQHSKRAFSLLSGGLDSRCIVSVLNHMGKEVVSFNSYIPGQQDHVFAKNYAKAVGVCFIDSQRPVDRRFTTETLLSYSILEGKKQVTDPGEVGLVFSGDGGSVGVGHVYMDGPLLDLLAAGKMDEAIVRFLEPRDFPGKIFRGQHGQYFRQICRVSMKKELEAAASVGPERGFFLFLLRNDQRRHLHGYFENIDKTRVELLLPFFDARLLEKIISLPVKPFLLHRFYHDWLNEFPEDVTQVPWQTYPGHLTCPVPDLKSWSTAATQWESGKNKKRLVQRLSQSLEIFALMRKKEFPSNYVSRIKLMVAICLHLVGVREYSYIFDFCRALYEFQSFPEANE